MHYEHITSAESLAELCKRFADAKVVAFDTEFVSEHSYFPQLCLIQLAIDGDLYVVDTMVVTDVTALWQAMVESDCLTIVHAGREELCFLLRSVDQVPANWFDTQIAAGLIGIEYPAGYGALVQRLTGETAPKGETRTDWRKRPLSPQQLEYALSDVIHLPVMRDKITAKLEKLDRTEWAASEIEQWMTDLQDALKRERWRKVSGLSGMNPLSMAVVRELWRWRDGEARRRNVPAKRVLRDDLIIEMSKRRTSDPQRIGAVRGMDRGDLKRVIPDLAEAIDRALNLPDSELPRGRHRKQLPSHFSMLGQFLYSAVSSVCRKKELAPSLVCNPTDVRELVAERLGFLNDDHDPLRLSQGWRAEVVGTLIDDLLAGKVAMRITDPASDEPLSIERL